MIGCLGDAWSLGFHTQHCADWTSWLPASGLCLCSNQSLSSSAAPALGFRGCPDPEWLQFALMTSSRPFFQIRSLEGPQVRQWNSEDRLQPLWSWPQCLHLQLGTRLALKPMKGILMSLVADGGGRITRTGPAKWFREWRLATKPHDLSVISGTLMAEGENRLLQAVLDFYPHCGTRVQRVHKCKHLHTKHIRVNLRLWSPPPADPSIGLNTLFTNSLRSY